MVECAFGLICLGFLFLLVGVIVRVTRGGGVLATRPAARNRQPARPAAAPPTVHPRTGDSMQARTFNAQPGQSVTFTHRTRGEITAKILGAIHYAELSQQRRGGNAPWVPTGNAYVALWMGDYMLYEWQSRLYLFDEGQNLTDQQINESFLPYAKQFAQSNQTATVTFAWPPYTWQMVDIGKYRVARAEGVGLRLNLGAEGRFIHARTAEGRALAVEDYQSGSGGLDTVWMGWETTWEAVKAIR